MSDVVGGTRDKVSQKVKYVDREFETVRFGKYKITSQIDKDNVEVTFARTGTTRVVSIQSALLSRLIDNTQPTVLGQGILGYGKYIAEDNPKMYSLWHQMLARCYSDSYPRKQDYKDCEVSDNFKSFQYFCEWCEKQVGFNVESFSLDKDLLIKGNKVYSENTCVFIPNSINLLLRFPKKRSIYRGVKGVKHGRFVSKLVRFGSNHHLGTYDTPEEAFLVYKEAKEAYVKEVANKWKDKIDPRAYEALMNWTIDIDD